MAKRQPNLTRADIVSEISGRTGLSRTDVRIIIEEFFIIIKESLSRGIPVQIRGFGSFIRKQRAAKKARNILKGTTIDIPAHEVPVFKPCKEFVSSIREQSRMH